MDIRIKKWLLYSLLSSWAGLAVIVASLLYGSQVLNPNPQGKWVLSYILSSEDETSLKIEKELLQRKSSAHFDELIIFLSAKSEKEINNLKSLGFYVAREKRQEIEKDLIGLTMPYFIVSSPRGEGVYAGKIESAEDGVRIAQSFYANRNLSQFPTSGCGSSLRAQRFFNPQALIQKQK